MAPFLNRRRRGGCLRPPIIPKPYGVDKRWLETTTPSAPFKGCFAAFFFMSRPPLLREGGDSPSPLPLQMRFHRFKTSEIRGQTTLYGWCPSLRSGTIECATRYSTRAQRGTPAV